MKFVTMTSLNMTGLMFLTALLVGCGAKTAPPAFASKLVPVTGTVTLNGNALAHATVFFMAPPNSSGLELAEATTDAEGKYELSTRMTQGTAQDRKGALPGDYIVTVSCIKMADGTPLPPGTTEADAMASGAIESVPQKFTNPESSPLKATVNSSPTTHDIVLTK